MSKALNILNKIAKGEAAIFFHRSEFRSDSENGRYAASVDRALRSQKAFDNFKRDKNYREILEHVSREKGAQYLEILQSRNDGILDLGLNSVLVSDDIGNPIKHSYEGFSVPLSPTTLRYLKVASDLRLLFGDDLGNVAEIGCGYGGQAIVNDQLLKVTFATLFDLPIVSRLIERYLDSYLLRGGYQATTINKTIPADYDLVISNYAFSELPKEVQMAYVNKILRTSKRGYLTMNSGLSGDRSIGKFSLGELRNLLPEFNVFQENPETSPHNYVIVWGQTIVSPEEVFVPLKL
jgi:hypothetical protein